MTKAESSQDKLINQILHLRDQGTVYIEEEEKKESEIAAGTKDCEPTTGLSQDTVEYLEEIKETPHFGKKEEEFHTAAQNGVQDSTEYFSFDDCYSLLKQIEDQQLLAQ